MVKKNESKKKESEEGDEGAANKEEDDDDEEEGEINEISEFTDRTPLVINSNHSFLDINKANSQKSVMTTTNDSINRSSLLSIGQHDSLPFCSSTSSVVRAVDSVDLETEVTQAFIQRSEYLEINYKILQLQNRQKVITNQLDKLKKQTSTKELSLYNTFQKELDAIKTKINKLQNQQQHYKQQHHITTPTLNKLQKQEETLNDIIFNNDSSISNNIDLPILEGHTILPKSQQHYTLSHTTKRRRLFLDDKDDRLNCTVHLDKSHDIIDDFNDERYNQRIHHWKEKMCISKEGEEQIVSIPENLIINGSSNNEVHYHHDHSSVDPNRDTIMLSNDVSKLDYHEINDDGLKIPLYLWTKLFPHQKEALFFFWRLYKQNTGGLLGDDMGLGKTIEVIGFLAALHFTSIMNHNIKSNMNLNVSSFQNSGTLIICPATVTFQWISECHRWYPPFRCFMFSSTNSKQERHSIVKKVIKVGGILVASYEIVRTDIAFLNRWNWNYVILDEGQKIRNPEAGITLAVKQFKTPHRIILSGSPIQNDLRELWSLFDFLCPGRLGNLDAFVIHFVDPIRLGGLSTASRSAALVAYNCASALRALIMPYFLRRSKSDVQMNLQLPPKSEQVLFCSLSPIQYIIYSDFLQNHNLSLSSKISQSKKNFILPYERRTLELPSTGKIFFALSVLRKICNHPDLLLLDQELETLPLDLGSPERSGKVSVLLQILNVWKQEKHRVLIFSQTIQFLNLLEPLLAKCQYTYRRIDGQVSTINRRRIIDEFHHDTSIFLLLLTARVGGVGLNLVAANRVIIFDPDWNPMTDVQARERSWRIGQTKDVIIYRLITTGTIEEKIYQRQIFKQFITKKVLDDPRQRRFFKINDLRELFELPPAPEDLSFENLPIGYRKLLGRVLGGLSLTAEGYKTTSKYQLEKSVLEQDRLSSGFKDHDSDYSLNDESVLEPMIEIDDKKKKSENYVLSDYGNNDAVSVDESEITTPFLLSQTSDTEPEVTPPFISSECSNSDEEITGSESVSLSAIPKRLSHRKKLPATMSPNNVKRTKQIEKMKKKQKLRPIETEIAGFESLGAIAMPTEISEESKTERNNLLQTLLSSGGVQGTVSHDFFEMSHPDFDLEQRDAIEQASISLQAIGAHLPFSHGSGYDQQEYVNKSHQGDRSVSILNLLRERATLKNNIMSVVDSKPKGDDNDNETHDEAIDPSWSNFITQQIKTYFKRRPQRKEFNSNELIEEFRNIVGSNDKKAHEFRRILRSLCDLNPITRYWSLKESL